MPTATSRCSVSTTDFGGAAPARARERRNLAGASNASSQRACGPDALPDLGPSPDLEAGPLPFAMGADAASAATPKVPLSDASTKPSVTVFSSSQRRRIFLASSGVITLSAEELAMVASMSANSFTMSLVIGMSGCVRENSCGLRMKNPPTCSHTHWAMRASFVTRTSSPVRSSGLPVPLPLASSGGSAHL